MRLNWRGSVRSQSGVSPGRFDGRLPQRISSCSGSARWSARKRCLHVRQSTSGSLKPPTWPDASQTSRVEDDRGVERDDVVPLLHHRLEPARLDVVLQQDAVVAVVVRRAEAAVDLRGREDEPAPLGRATTILSIVTASVLDMSRRVSDSLRAVTPAREIVELHIVSDSTGETAARLVAGARGAVPGAAVRGGAASADPDDRRPAARGQPREGPAGGDGLHARRPRAARGDARRSAAARGSTTATCSGTRSSRSRRSRAWPRR